MPAPAEQKTRLRLMTYFNVMVTTLLAMFLLGTPAHAETSQSQISLSVQVVPKKLGTLGVWVTGLGSNKTLTLQNNGTENLSITANGGSTFAAQYVKGTNYAVTVSLQPTAQLCKVVNGTGTITSDLTSLTVNCVNTYTIGGTVTGLTLGKKFILTNNKTDPLTISANGNFVFKNPIVEGESYAASIGIQPTGQKCVLSNGSGTNVMSNVSSINVNCDGTYTVSGTVLGLNVPGLIIRMNGASKIIPSGATSFSFASSMTPGTAYAVTIAIQPTGLKCTVSGGNTGTGAGVINNTNITNVVINCNKTYTVGGTLSGLTTAGLVLKLNNTSSLLIPAGATTFKFASGLQSTTSYEVTIGAQPAGKTCSITNGSGIISIADITNVMINCH
jgi:hypothetical protein